jgi:hypothetical protein
MKSTEARNPQRISGGQKPSYSGLQMNVQVDNDFAIFFSRIAAPEFSRGFQPCL